MYLDVNIHGVTSIELSAARNHPDKTSYRTMLVKTRDSFGNEQETEINFFSSRIGDDGVEQLRVKA